MTEDDAVTLGELGRALAVIDVDETRARGIARRAREFRPSPLRFVEPVLTVVIAIGYLLWALLKVLEPFR